MDTKIDYISFTEMTDVRRAGDEQAQQQAAIAALSDNFPSFVHDFAACLSWQAGSARGHYALSIFQPDSFTTIRYGGKANHILVEMPGTACQMARDTGALEAIITQAAERLTRLDIATDIENGCSPLEFVRAGYNERFKSYAEIVSESGITEYVGSMKSERFSRVYMYSPPHPRAGTLRVETVLRSDFAKAAGQIFAHEGVLHLAALCGNTFGWKHTSWKPESLTDGKLRASRADRHEPGRVRWLYQVVLPAIKRAANDGLIDLPDFLGRLAAL